ncbi:hypothetical protein [Leptospira noguchii]|uniref:hypothetical protein n=1 Tax=Leptospira noguchii TaxID=28182 RepID=UPI001FB5BBA3|nr:hypothetical protein [Leptospira noguchii]UOG59058.1 hypothetical protein MAL07_09445 [Leptospira noguchii]
MHRSLRVALQGRVNSAKRSPKLNASLPKGRSAGSRFRFWSRLRVVGTHTFLRIQIES